MIGCDRLARTRADFELFICRPPRGSSRRVPPRPPERDRDPALRRPGPGLDLEADADLLGGAVGDVAHHPHALVELDHRDRVGELAAEGLAAVLTHDGEGVHDAAPARDLPLRGAAARRADRPRVELALAARRAALDPELAAPRRAPEGLARRVELRERPVVGAVAANLHQGRSLPRITAPIAESQPPEPTQ